MSKDLLNDEKIFEDAKAFVERLNTTPLSKTEALFIAHSFVTHLLDELTTMHGILTKLMIDKRTRKRVKKKVSKAGKNNGRQ